MFIWWVILILVVYHFLVFLLDLMIIFNYEHPDDSQLNQGLLAKTTVLIGLQLTWLLVSGVPVDAYNTFQDGGFDMEVYWLLAFLATFIYLILPLPFSIFFYEADSDLRISKTPAWKKASIYTAIFMACVTVLIAGIMFPLCRTTYIPVDTFDCLALVGTDAPPGGGTCEGPTPTHLQFGIDFFTFLMGAVAFVGWMFLVVFLGVGLAALPIDLIVGYVDRPQPMDISQYSDYSKVLGEKAGNLVTYGQNLKERELGMRLDGGIRGFRLRREFNRDLNRYRQSVYLLEREYSRLQTAMQQRGENPALSMLKLVLGVCCCILSITWVLHILLYMIIPGITGVAFAGFLNDFLLILSGPGIFILEFIVFSVLILYLQICVIKGCFKFGMRLFFCFPIHPMRLKNTHYNSILFNTAILVLASSALVHFSQLAFSEYCRFTAVDHVFGTQIQNISFIGWFFRQEVFLWLLLCWFIVCAVYLSVRPRDRISLKLDDIKPLPPKMQTTPQEQAAPIPEDALIPPAMQEVEVPE